MNKIDTHIYGVFLPVYGAVVIGDNIHKSL